MKISIITPCFNSEATIEETIRSVLSQDHADLEYILIDGQSTDGTLKIVERYRQRFAKVVSEKDGGIYDAINKGIALATGEVVGILHSDDTYAHPEVLSKVAGAFAGGVDSVYADLQYVARDNPSKVIRHWTSGLYRHGMFSKGWMPPHPTFFLRRECYARYGDYTLKLRSASDYELMLRMLHKHRITVSYLPEVLVKMKVGGKSNISLVNRLKANREDKLAWEMNGLKAGRLTHILKPLSKIGQYFRP